MNQLNNASITTPTPGDDWLHMSDAERIASVNKAFTEISETVDGVLEVIEGKDDGQVILRLHNPLPPHERGTVLLDVEDHLKAKVDPSIVVWLEPLGDKNSLRNLRGIEVKS